MIILAKTNENEGTMLLMVCQLFLVGSGTKCSMLLTSSILVHHAHKREGFLEEGAADKNKMTS
jgi:hypothetical protein